MKGSADTLFNEIYTAHADELFRYCLLLTKDRNRAIDCSQETFVRFLQYLRNGKKVEYPKAFLFRTAKNFVIDQSRKKTAGSLDLMAEEGFEPVSTHASDAIETQASAGQTLSRLRSKHPEAYELVALRHAYNLSIPELAKIYDTTENAMSVRIHRALQTLQGISEQ